MRLYTSFIDPVYCLMVNAFNKENAINSLLILDSYSFPGVLAIVDSDFHILERNLPTNRNLLPTDFHDLETMLLVSPALDKVLSEFGSTEKMARFVSLTNKTILSTLTDSGLPIGYLRWLSLRENLSLKFEDLSFIDFVDANTLAVDEAQLITTVKNHSKQMTLDEQWVMDRLIRLKNPAYDPLHVCCGHDLICILSIGLRRLLGSHDTSEVKPHILERSLRLSYEYQHFKTTKLFNDIKQWEKANPSFKILKP